MKIKEKKPLNFWRKKWIPFKEELINTHDDVQKLVADNIKKVEDQILIVSY